MSTTHLRDYQTNLKNQTYQAWRDGARGVLATTATGGGKTTVYSSVLEDFNTDAVLIAHRAELLAQSALALNREGVPHSIVAPKSTINEIVKLEYETHGHSKFAYRAPIRVAGVDTLVKQCAAPEPWLQRVGLVVVDEGHHALAANKWGRCVALFPNARILGVTAHAVRADGAGLGRHADGIYDALVIGPHGRELIERGFLCEYTLRIPPNDIDFSQVEIGSTGDYKANQVAAATHKSRQLVGDVVKHYLAFARGKLGLTFVVDIKAANETCAAFRANGVPTEIITGETHMAARAQIMKRFRERQILQLVSVDVLGEGTDVPAVEVVSLARRTASWQLLCQQIGRALRPMLTTMPKHVQEQWGYFTDAERRQFIRVSEKPKALILDHVGNVMFHFERRGMPDALQVYTLDRADRKGAARSGLEPLRTCLECYQPFERFMRACPHCGAEVPPPSERGSPEQVEGDLVELNPDVLAALRGEWLRVDSPCVIPRGMPEAGQKAHLRRHHERYEAQQALRVPMGTYGGYWLKQGLDDRDIQRKFYHVFGVDTLTAVTLSAQDAATLQLKIEAELIRLNVRGNDHAPA